jgi:hypothetical protein
MVGFLIRSGVRKLCLLSQYVPLAICNASVSNSPNAASSLVFLIHLMLNNVINITANRRDNQQGDAKILTAIIW